VDSSSQENDAVAFGATSEGDEEATVADFLELLARDIDSHPDRVREMPPELYERLRAVTTGMFDADVDDPIIGPVAL
jgi:hypothetical protein